MKKFFYVFSLLVAFVSTSALSANSDWQRINPDAKYNHFWNVVDIRPVASEVLSMTACYAYNDKDDSVGIGYLVSHFKKGVLDKVSISYPNTTGLTRTNHPPGFLFQFDGKFLNGAFSAVSKAQESVDNHVNYDLAFYEKGDKGEPVLMDSSKIFNLMKAGKVLEFMTKHEASSKAWFLKCSLKGFTHAYNKAK